jgi:hypothetical protein
MFPKRFFKWIVLLLLTPEQESSVHKKTLPSQLTGRGSFYIFFSALASSDDFKWYWIYTLFYMVELYPFMFFKSKRFLDLEIKVILLCFFEVEFCNSFVN